MSDVEKAAAELRSAADAAAHASDSVMDAQRAWEKARDAHNAALRRFEEARTALINAASGKAK